MIPWYGRVWKFVERLHKYLDFLKKVARGANPGSFDFVYFLIPSLYR
jgi:hypothetical protein